MATRRGRRRRPVPHHLRATRGPKPPDKITAALRALVLEEFEAIKQRALSGLRLDAATVAPVGPIVSGRLAARVAEAGGEIVRRARSQTASVLGAGRVPETLPGERAAGAQFLDRVFARVGDAGLREALQEALDAGGGRAKVEAAVDSAAARTATAIKDSAQKLHTETVQKAAEAAGVRHYVWTTQLDELVRPGHADLEGSIQRWDERPVAGEDGHRAHPTEDPNCRCQAYPWDDPAQPEDEPTAPPPRAPENTPTAPPPAPVVDPEQAAREARWRAAAEARTSLERFAYRVQFGTGVPVEYQTAAAKAVEHVGLRGLNEFRLAPSIKSKDAAGTYYPGFADLHVRTEGLGKVGRELPDTPGPGKLWSIGSQPSTIEGVVRNTTYHELGHHAHMFGGKYSSNIEPRARAAAGRIDDLILARWNAPDREFLTDYAVHPKTPKAFSHAEYFAEAFAAYHAEPAWLRRVAPKAYNMVEEVIRIRKALDQ